jgi:hypothetical protein
MYGRIGAGRERRVPYDCFSIGVAVMGVGVYGPGVQQIAQPPFAEAIVVALQQIASQGINCDLQYQPRSLGLLSQGTGNRQCDQDQGKSQRGEFPALIYSHRLIHFESSHAPVGLGTY